jgi:hypothetical protein
MLGLRPKPYLGSLKLKVGLPTGPVFPLGELGGRLGRQISRGGKNTEKWKNMKDKSATTT